MQKSYFKLIILIIILISPQSGIVLPAQNKEPEIVENSEEQSTKIQGKEKLIDIFTFGKFEARKLIENNILDLDIENHAFELSVISKEELNMSNFFEYDGSENESWKLADLSQIYVINAYISDGFNISKPTNLVTNEIGLWADFTIGEYRYEIKPIEHIVNQNKIVDVTLEHSFNKERVERTETEKLVINKGSLTLSSTSYQLKLEMVSSYSFFYAYGSNWAAQIVSWHVGGSDNPYDEYYDDVGDIEWINVRMFTFINGAGPSGENIAIIISQFEDWILTLSNSDAIYPFHTIVLFMGDDLYEYTICFPDCGYETDIYGYSYHYSSIPFHLVECTDCSTNPFEDWRPIIVLQGISEQYAPYNTEDAVRYVFAHELGHVLDAEHGDRTWEWNYCIDWSWGGQIRYQFKYSIMKNGLLNTYSCSAYISYRSWYFSSTSKNTMRTTLALSGRY